MKRVLIKNMIHQQSHKNQEIGRRIQANIFGQGAKASLVSTQTFSSDLRL
jgi:hypothetical protein